MFEILAQITYDPIQRWGPVSPHGLGTAFGFLAGAYLMARRAEPRGIPRAEVYNAVTWGAIGAILGARIFYVLPRLDQFDSLGDILRVWEGGLTMFGGFVGGLTLGLGYLWRRKFDIPQALEAAAPGFVVGVIIGRIGDIIIADHLGEETGFFLGYQVPPPPAEIAPGFGPPHFVPGGVYHHTALYDFAGAVVLLGVIYLVARRRPAAPALFGTFSLWYGLQRFGIDFTRNKEVIESAFLWFSGSQWAGLGFALAGVVMLYRASRSPAPLAPSAAVASAVPAALSDIPPPPVAGPPPITPPSPSPAPPSTTPLSPEEATPPPPASPSPSPEPSPDPATPPAAPPSDNP